MFSKFFKNSPFRKNILVLLGGTAIAQIIPIIASPILTRIFLPAEFGYYANFMAISAFASVYISGKYELAILLPKEDKDAVNVLFLSAFLALINSIILVLFFSVFSHLIAHKLNLIQIEKQIWLIPIASFISVLYLIINEWMIRKKDFLKLIKNKISNTTGITVVSLFSGFLNLSPGLIIGQIFGQLLSVFMAIFRILQSYKDLFQFISISKMKYYIYKYSNFPKFNIPGQFLNTISGQLPILIFSARFGPEMAGFYAMSDRVLAVPLTYIGNSFNDVFKQRAAEDFKVKGNCIELYKKTTIMLIKLSFIPFIILYIFSPFLFSFFFGPSWVNSGNYIRIICLMYFFSFISMPTSWLFVIAEKQRLDLIWQSIFFTLTMIALALGYIYNDVNTMLFTFCIARSIAYCIQIFFTYNLAKGHKKYAA